ncbi:hypothetical protein [African swine fever virus]|uniref:Uncharacterized protein n=1 Tax=African swine fever virus TaxID=10497 RepID=A0A6G8F0F9_ASF|nr:hypothetical protein [African swine fever virus]UCX55261.1 hypothetical protein [African swine fever virus]
MCATFSTYFRLLPIFLSWWCSFIVKQVPPWFPNTT